MSDMKKQVRKNHLRSFGSNKSMTQLLFGSVKKQKKSKKYRAKTDVAKKKIAIENEKRSKTDIQNASAVLPMPKTKPKVNFVKSDMRKTTPLQFSRLSTEELGTVIPITNESDTESRGSKVSKGSASKLNLPENKLSNREKRLKGNQVVNRSLGSGKLGSGRLGSERLGSGRKRGYSNKIQRSIADMSESIALSKIQLSPNDSERELRVTEAAQSLLSRKFSKKAKGALNTLSERFQFGLFAYDDFDCFTKPPEYFRTFFTDAFVALELNSLYDDNEDLLLNFIEEVRNNYKSPTEVPFHNFYHGFSVCQVAIAFVIRCQHLRKLCDKQTLFMFIVAALCHDLDHPGTSNYYETEALSSIVEEHGKVSPLENMHTEKFLSVLSDNDYANNIFQFMSATTQENINDYVAELIVATDMGKHGDNMKFVKETERKDLDNLHEENVLPLLCALLHACDLSGQCFSQDIAKIWEENIHKEMETQYNKLTEKGLPIPNTLTHFAGGKTPSMQSRCKSQANFIDFHLIPYWVEITRIFPEMEDFLVNLKANGKYFRSEAA